MPVWRYRTWVQDTVKGAGSSGTPHDELKRRRLTDSPGGELPLVPPAADVCNEDETGCTLPDPVWQPGSLVGAAQSQGMVVARCSDVAGAPACTFNRVSYAGGVSGRFALGGAREVMAWCTARVALNVGDPPQDVLMVSFTNTNQRNDAQATGWWYVSPDTVTGIGAGLRPC
jgi:hypothetical protein